MPRASLAAERAERTNSSSAHERSINRPDLAVVERHHGAADALRLLANDVQALAVHGHPVANELGNRADVPRLDHRTRTLNRRCLALGPGDACVPGGE
jgi:hypothetical protein